MVNFSKIAIFIFIFFFVSCEKNDKENLLFPTKTTNHSIQTQDGLQFLNSLRYNSGLNTLSRNEILDLASKNHAFYSSFYKHHGHDEDSSLMHFTGQNPVERGFYSGYFSHVAENISYKKDSISAIDTLFTAIYHRFLMLSFAHNEVGFFIENSNDFPSAVFKFGNSYLDKICQGKGDSGYGTFYTNICKDKNLKIEVNRYKKTLNFANPEYVIFPYKNAENISIYFSGETPDPMPSCKITANPISVQFNPLEKKILMQNFKLYKGENEIYDTKIIEKNNDLNLRFTDKEFALFGLNVFDFNTTYKAVFSYLQDKEHKTIQWSFKTELPKRDFFTLLDSNENLAIKPGVEYDIFLKPKNCNDVFNHIKSKYPSSREVFIDLIGVNTLRVKVNGYSGDKIVINADNGKVINLILQETSEHFKGNFKKNLIIGFIILVLAIFVGLFGRKT